jgi:hypothetical protein
MWEAMPVLFRDLLPEGREDEGWGAFGLITEDTAALPPDLEHPRPVGTSLRTSMGIDRIFLNCAGCHAGSVRTEPGAPPLIVAGMPSNTVDLSAFQGFLAAAAVDERFSPDRFLTTIDAMDLDLDPVNPVEACPAVIGVITPDQRVPVAPLDQEPHGNSSELRDRLGGACVADHGRGAPGTAAARCRHAAEAAACRQLRDRHGRTGPDSCHPDPRFNFESNPHAPRLLLCIIYNLSNIKH